jgi:hypothetical protein
MSSASTRPRSNSRRSRGTAPISPGAPAFYRQHQALEGFVQVALRFHHGGRDWPAVVRELSKTSRGKPVRGGLLSGQSVNTERLIRP